MTVQSSLRINCGAGGFNLAGYENIDELGLGADIVRHVPPLPYRDGEAAEIWACHFFEHLDRAEARLFLQECRRVLPPGGTLGLVVPDTHQIMSRYITGAKARMEWPEGVFRDLHDLDEICSVFLYSTEQESRHQWSYDIRTLRRLVESEGFVFMGEVDRHNDPRIAVGAWYQCGADWVRK